jgi:hypothetical protein
VAYFDIDTACREGFGDRKLVAMIQQRISSLDEDLDQGEQEFLVSYAYQDLRYYLLYKFGLFNLDNNDASMNYARELLEMRILWLGWLMSGLIGGLLSGDRGLGWFLMRANRRVMRPENRKALRI